MTDGAGKRMTDDGKLMTGGVVSRAANPDIQISKSVFGLRQAWRSCVPPPVPATRNNASDIPRTLRRDVLADRIKYTLVISKHLQPLWHEHHSA